MANAKRKTATVSRVTDDMKVQVLKRENPFREGTIKAKNAAAILGASGKTVGDIKALRKGEVNSSAILELSRMKIVALKKTA